MAIVINGSGTVTGLAVGGLPDGTVDAGTVAADVATQAEIDAKLNLAGGTMTGNLLVNNGSSAKLGIGTSPSHMLHVVAPASIGDYAVKIDTPDRYGLRIEADGAAAANPLIILDGSTTIFTVKGDGRGVSGFTARAWAKINGTGTLAVDDSHNVSSVTDNSTGNYTINFDVDMASGAHCSLASTSAGNRTIGMTNFGAATVDVLIAHNSDTGNYVDDSQVNVVTFDN